MTEVRVDDWDHSVAWYRDVLGLRVVLEDPPHRFALLDEGEGGGRVALKGGSSADGTGRGAVRLVFEVADLDAVVVHLRESGVAFVGPRSSAEGYREVKLCDPDGTPIGLFAWARSDAE